MKYPRRHTRVTYEGISFMSVLAFIILGSIIRQINLLVLLSGLMIAPFFFNWRISMKMLERLRSRRRLPESVHAGTPFSIRWQINNDRERIPSWGIRVTDRLKPVQAESQNMEQVSVLVSPIQPATQVEVSYRCLLPARGLFEFGPAEVSSAFPVGLFRSKIKYPETETLVVAPRLGQLTRSWSQFMRSRRDGETHKQRQRSTHDGEFYAIRPWTSGDNPRQVHWRSSARHGELMVRQHEQQTDRRLMLLLDLYASGVSRTDIEQTLSFVTTILHRYAKGRSQSAVGLFADQQLVCNKLNRSTMPGMMRALATIQPAEDNQLGEGLASLIAQSGRRGQMIMISTRSREEASEQHNLSALAGAWIDVSRGDMTRFFLPPVDTTKKFIGQVIESGKVVA